MIAPATLSHNSNPPWAFDPSRPQSIAFPIVPGLRQVGAPTLTIHWCTRILDTPGDVVWTVSVLDTAYYGDDRLPDTHERPPHLTDDLRTADRTSTIAIPPWGDAGLRLIVTRAAADPADTLATACIVSWMTINYEMER